MVQRAVRPEPERGAMVAEVELFIAVLGASNYT